MTVIQNINNVSLSFPILYYLRPEILVGGMDVSRCILVLNTFISIHFCDK